MRKRSIEIDLLQAFVSVAEARSFTQAAENLHLTQSAVSLKIKKLEEQVQHVLLERSAPVRPTAMGARLLATARRLIEAHEAAFEELMHTRPQGRIVIGTSQTYAASILAPVLKSFRQSHPGVEIVILCAHGWELLQAQARGEIELVVTTRTTRRTGTRLRQERIVWACAGNAAVAHGKPLRLALFPEGCVYRAAALEALSRAGRSWDVAYTCTHYDGLLAAVEQDLVLTAITRSAVPDHFEILDGADGLPELPTVEVALYKAPGLSATARRLAAAIESQTRGCARASAAPRPEPLGMRQPPGHCV
jgi:DNA-binding transcriptional LysR family regulator